MAEMEAKGDKSDERLENRDEVKKAKQQEEQKEMQIVQGEKDNEMELKADEMVDETVQKKEENGKRDDGMKEHENGKKNDEMGHKEENDRMNEKEENAKIDDIEKKEEENEEKNEENEKKNEENEKKNEENEKKNEEKEQMEEKNAKKDDMKQKEENNARMVDMGQKDVIVSKAEEMQLQMAINEEEKPKKMKLTKKSEEMMEVVGNREENNEEMDEEMSVEESKNDEKVEVMGVEEENKNSDKAKQMMPSTQNCEKTHILENEIDTRMIENAIEENIEKSGNQYEGDQEMNDAEQDEKKTSPEEEDDRSSTSMGLLLSTASTSEEEVPKKYRKASTIPANKKYLQESSSSSYYSEDGSPMTSARTSGIIPKKEATRDSDETETSPEGEFAEDSCRFSKLLVKSSSEESSAEDYADTSYSRKSTTEISSDDGANTILPSKDLPMKIPMLSQDSQDKVSSQENASVDALSKRVKRRLPRNKRTRSYPRKRFRTRYLSDLIKYRDRPHSIIKLRNYLDSEDKPNLPTIGNIVIEEEDISSISTTGEIHELEIGAEISIENSTQKSDVESDSDSTLKQSSPNEGVSRKRPSIDNFIAYKKVRVTFTNSQRSIKVENSDKEEAGEIYSVQDFDAKDFSVDSSLERDELKDSTEGSSKIACNNDVAARADSKTDNTLGKCDESTANDCLKLKKSGRKRRASSDSESDVSKKSKPVESKCSVETKDRSISPVDSANHSRPNESTTSQLFIMKSGESRTNIETVNKNCLIESAGRRETMYDQKPVTEESTAEMRTATDQKPETEVVSSSALETNNEEQKIENSISGMETNDQKSSSKDMLTSMGLEQDNSQGSAKPTITASSKAIETHLAELKMSSNSDNSDKSEKNGEETNDQTKNDEPMDL